jgi:ubiquinone/menaquinone biosynthesis C-methylase UbiE
MKETAMSDNLDAVREHYGAVGLSDRLRGMLGESTGTDRSLDPGQLMFDHFHTRGLQATAELAELTGIAPDSAVLDVGSGIGGPARYLAASYGCSVSGVDTSAPFVEAARYLTERTGQADRVRFEVGSALDLPFPSARFDVALLQHVAMNIADRSGLYGEIRRVLRPDGKFATYDIVTRDGSVHYPVPWALTPATSFLLSAEETRDSIERAGFRLLELRDDSAKAQEWATNLRNNPPPLSATVGLITGAAFADVTGNLVRSLLEGKIGVLTAVFATTGVAEAGA